MLISQHEKLLLMTMYLANPGTEYEILAMLVQHAGEVISKEQISEQV